MNPEQTIAINIRRFRASRGMSIVDTANAAGISRQALGNIEKGLMAGLGAAGGAGLGGAITSSGATTLGAAADTANFANLGMNTTAVAPPTAFESFKGVINFFSSVLTRASWVG